MCTAKNNLEWLSNLKRSLVYALVYYFSSGSLFVVSTSLQKGQKVVNHCPKNTHSSLNENGQQIWPKTFIKLNCGVLVKNLNIPFVPQMRLGYLSIAYIFDHLFFLRRVAPPSTTPQPSREPREESTTSTRSCWTEGLTRTQWTW